MKKVYLAKSNLVDPTNYIVIKGLLERYDCQVVEWKAGPNQQQDLLDCDILLVLMADIIPPMQNENIKGYYVGRGIYGQLSDFNKQDLPKKILVANQVMCTQPLQTQIIVNEFKSIKENDVNDWKVKYGKCTVSSFEASLVMFVPLKP